MFLEDDKVTSQRRSLPSCVFRLCTAQWRCPASGQACRFKRPQPKQNSRQLQYINLAYGTLMNIINHAQSIKLRSAASVAPLFLRLFSMHQFSHIRHQVSGFPGWWKALHRQRSHLSTGSCTIRRSIPFSQPTIHLLWEGWKNAEDFW